MLWLLSRKFIFLGGGSFMVCNSLSFMFTSGEVFASGCNLSKTGFGYKVKFKRLVSA